MNRRTSIVCLLALSAFAQAPQSDSGFVLSGGTVHTISGPVIENGSVLVRNGKIVAVGKSLSAPKGYKNIDIRGQHVYPGMIDSASMLGLEKAAADLASDADEMGSLNPQLRAASAVNPSSDQISISRASGITSVIEMPDGSLLAGQMSLIHLDGSTNEAMTLVPLAAVHLRFPAITTVPIPPHEADDDDDDPAASAAVAPITYSQAKQSYEEKLRSLNTFFDEARHYRKAKLAKTRGFREDLKYEAFLPVLEGSTPLFVTAVREREIREAIEFADRQKIKIILADAYEAYKLLPLIKSHKIPIVLGPTRSLPLNEDDPDDRSFTLPGELHKAGIKFSIATFSATRSRSLPYQAATAVPFGLPQDEAYKVVSLNAAEIFGVGKRLGSIDEGKIADLIVTDGDPLDVRTHVTMVFIDGKPVDPDGCTRELVEKYRTRQ